VSFQIKRAEKTHHESENDSQKNRSSESSKRGAGVKNQDLCRKHGISEQTFYNCRKKFGGMQVSEAKRLRELETEKLKQLLAEAHLDNAALKEVLSKNWQGPRSDAEPLNI